MTGFSVQREIHPVGVKRGRQQQLGSVGGGIAKKKQKALLCGRLPPLTCPCPGPRYWTRAGWATEGAGDEVRIELGGVLKSASVCTVLPLVSHLWVHL